MTKCSKGGFLSYPVTIVLLIILFQSKVLASDGGISIQGTRVIYNQNSKQENVYIRNSSTTDSFLVQSWIENSDGQKVQDFVVTPPIYLSAPKNENILRLMIVKNDLPTNKESIYYLVVKAIPSVEKNESSKKGIIRVAAASKIKLFSRPKGLLLSPEKAPQQLVFTKVSDKIEVRNPTPYYITLTDITIGSSIVSSMMIAPMSVDKFGKEYYKENKVSFSTINDYGTVTKPVTLQIH